MVELRQNELKILATLSRLTGGKTSAEQLVTGTGLSDAAVMRSALTLKEENLVRIHEEKETVLSLNAEGEVYAKHGLPERQMVSALERLGGKGSLEKVVKEAALGKQARADCSRLGSEEEVGSS